VPVALLLFSLEFSGRREWVSPPKLAALLAIPLITLLLAFSNDSHRFIWSEWSLESIGDTLVLRLEHNALFWVYFLYTYILLAVSTVLIFRGMTSRSKNFRRQTVSLLIGIAIPWVGNAISNLNLIPTPLDLTPFAFIVTGLAISWSIYKHQFLNIDPVAFETVVDSINDVVFILDMGNNVLFINSAGKRELKLAGNDVLGRNAKEVFKEQAELIDLYQNAMNIREEVVIGTDSREQYYELSISPLTDHQDKILGRAFMLRDITDRKQAEKTMLVARDQALEANRAKSHFLARVGHELRTPLGVIRGYADLLKEPAYGSLSELQDKAVSEIIDSTQRVSDMVAELLDEARLAAGAVELEIKSYQPAMLLNDVKEKLSVLAQKKGLTLTTSLDPELPEKLIGDPKRINQMVTNLASNSIKFTKEGEVSIRFYMRSKKRWAMEVTDTGPGIPKKAQKDIFEPYRQADGSISKKYGGTGLGLSIVKHLTSMMNGKITVKSKVGKGSTFTIIIPLEVETFQ
jgi:PAS domain S-box-containing protein